MWNDEEGDQPPARCRSQEAASYAAIAEAILTSRKKFGRAFGFDLATDPNGDMLLYLYIREHDGRTTSLSALWGASNVAYSTARRCVTAMEERGVVQRFPDPSDGRRYLVGLTPRAHQLIEAGLELVRLAGACLPSRNDGSP